jgi:hypothetical protein
MRAPAILLFIALGTLACLAPAQNDTWWHLRSGQEMLRTHHLLFEDRFSFTAAGQFFWNHSWLSQVLFYALYEVGGLPLMTAACAAAILGAWAVLWRMLSGQMTDRLLLVAIALPSATVTWSLRPQAFSLLLMATVLWLVSEDRWKGVPWLFVLWANLHAGFVLGLVIVAVAVAVAALFDRDRLAARAGWAMACGVATLVTPLGYRNWIEILQSMDRSHVNAIQEWRPPALPPEHLFFWLLGSGVLVLAVLRWNRLSSPSARVIAATAVLVFPLAARSFRNVPAFAMLAVPACGRLIDSTPDRTSAGGPLGRAGRIAVSVAAALAVAVVGWAWTTGVVLGWRPMSPEAARSIAACPGPLYNTYEGGGPIIWFVPSQKVFVDSRQDPFPVALVQEATEVERTGDYRRLFATWGINCAALPPSSPTAVRLATDGWTMRFSDAQWLVLERPTLSPTTATRSPAP